MYCPKCNSEYREGFTRCPECMVDLVDSLPEKDKEEVVAIKPVKLISVSNEIEAGLIINLLLNNDIPCFKKSKGAGGYMSIYMGYSIFGEDIYVDEKDYERAKELLEELSFDCNKMEEKKGNKGEDEANMDGETKDELSQVEVYKNEGKENYPIPFYRKPQFVARILLALFIGSILFSFIINL